MTPEPLQPSFVTNLVMGFWALLGGAMRGLNEWRDPATGKFSAVRMLSGLATALVLGEIAIAGTQYFHVDTTIGGALAAVLGYLGPAATIGIIQSRFPATRPKDAADASKG